MLPLDSLPSMLFQALGADAASSAGEFRNVVYPAILDSVRLFWPEMQVVVLALGILIADFFLPLRRSRDLAWVALLGILVPLARIGIQYGESGTIFRGMMAVDPFAHFFKFFFLLASVPVILLSYLSKTFEGRRMGEYYFVLLVAVFGAMLMVSSSHFLMIFLSLETLSVSSYILVGYVRRDRKGA